MTIPTQMNCTHIGDGWCLDCVRKLSDERDVLKKATLDLAFDSGDYSAILEELATLRTLRAQLAARESEVAQLRAVLEFGFQAFDRTPKFIAFSDVLEFTEKAKDALAGAK